MKPKTPIEEALGLVQEIRNPDPPRVRLEAKINQLLRQNRYKHVELRNSYCEYYAKLLDHERSKVFIKSWGYDGSNLVQAYHCAEVYQENLEEFCKRFDTYEKKRIRNEPTGLGFLVGGIGGAAIATLITVIALYPQERLSQVMQDRLLGMATMGFFFGLIFGTVTYEAIKDRFNKKKLGKCYHHLTRGMEAAIKEAFG